MRRLMGIFVIVGADVEHGDDLLGCDESRALEEQRRIPVFRSYFSPLQYVLLRLIFLSEETSKSALTSRRKLIFN